MTPNTPMTELPVELEPCPFCGGAEVSFNNLTFGSGQVLTVRLVHHCNGDDSPFLEFSGKNKTEAIAAWNRRASQSLRAPAGEVVAWRLTTREGVEHLFNVEDNARSYAEATGGFVTPLYASPPSEGVKVTDEMVERAFKKAPKFWRETSEARKHMRGALEAAPSSGRTT